MFVLQKTRSHQLFSLIFKFFVTLSLLSVAACNDGGDGPADSGAQQQAQALEAEYGIDPLEAEYLVMEDSFERDDLFSDENINQLFGYRGFIWDYGQPVVGTSGRDIDMVILDDDHWGEASDGNRALYFYGREGYSIHNMYLITRTYDLRGVDELEIDFDYITFRLNDPKDREVEYLKFEVCAATPVECGVKADGSFNYNKVNGSKWKTLMSRAPTHQQQDQRYNGKNHKKRDWLHANININVTEFEHREHMIFRFAAKMADGLHKNNPKFHIEDGVAIDMLRVRATDYFECQGTECNPDDDNGGGNDPDDEPGDACPDGWVDLGDGVCLDPVQ